MPPRKERKSSTSPKRKSSTSPKRKSSTSPRRKSTKKSSKGKEGKARRKPFALHKRADDLDFSVGKLKSELRQHTNGRVSTSAAVFLASTLQQVTQNVSEASFNALDQQQEKRAVKRLRITPRDIMLGIHGDENLYNLFEGDAILEAGVMPFVHEVVQDKTVKETRKRKRLERELDGLPPLGKKSGKKSEGSGKGKGSGKKKSGKEGSGKGKGSGKKKSSKKKSKKSSKKSNK